MNNTSASPAPSREEVLAELREHLHASALRCWKMPRPDDCGLFLALMNAIALIERDGKDAERYRWLRDPANGDRIGRERYSAVCRVCHESGDDLDNAIDAELAREK